MSSRGQEPEVSQGRAANAGASPGLGRAGACANDVTAARIRDGALIALLYASGLRRAEVVALCVDDYNAETGELRAMGKGNKQRNLWIDNEALDALADWPNLRGLEPGALFVPITKGGKFRRGATTAQAVYKMPNKRALQARAKRFSPHDLRRPFISDQLDAGTDVVTVKALAGHASPNTTAKYDRRGGRAKQRAAKALPVPYQRRILKRETGAVVVLLTVAEEEHRRRHTSGSLGKGVPREQTEAPGELQQARAVSEFGHAWWKRFADVKVNVTSLSAEDAAEWIAGKVLSWGPGTEDARVCPWPGTRLGPWRHITALWVPDAVWAPRSAQKGAVRGAGIDVDAL